LFTCLATVALLLPAGLAAQDTSRVPSATLLRRIAEAVASQTAATSVFVVANQDSVAGVERTRPAAVELARRLGRGFDVHGPYRPRREIPEIDHVVFGCVHDGLSNMRAICNYQRIVLSQIRSMSLVVRMNDGTSRTIDLPSGTDAVVLTAEAYDKFVFPYYQRLLGVEGAYALRRGHLGGTPK
jgi:hypothetical protein